MKLLKFFYLFPLLLTSGEFDPAPLNIAISIELDGHGGQIPVGSAIVESGYVINRKDDPYNLTILSPRCFNTKWHSCAFSFVPGLDGEVSLRLRNTVRTPGQSVWIQTRKVMITCGKIVYSLSSSDCHDRMCYTCPLYHLLLVTKAQRVFVSFEARMTNVEPESNDSRLIHPVFNPYWQDKNIKLLGPDNLGFPFAIYGMGKDKLVAPKFVFDQPVVPAKSDPRDDFSIPVSFLEENGISRKTVLRFGFPLPEHGFFDLEHFRVSDMNGIEVPAGFAALGYWPDNSLKWVLIEFDAHFHANEQKQYLIQGGIKVKRSAPRISQYVSIEDGKHHISVGAVRASIDPSSSALLQDISYNNIRLGNLTLAMGSANRLQIDHIICESWSPAVRIDGRIFGKRFLGSITARFFFSPVLPGVRLILTWCADNLAWEINEVKSLSVFFETETGTFANGVRHIFQGNDHSYFVDHNEYPGFMQDSAVYVTDKGKRICIGLKDAGRRYPKAFVASDRGIDIQLLPVQPSTDFNYDLPGYLRFPYMNGKYRFMTGMQMTDEIIFDFSGCVAIPQEIIAVIPPSWHARSKAIRGVAAQDVSTSFDKCALAEFRRHLARKHTLREYGFQNYGDWYGERGGNWGNNEYDLSYGLMTLFARTGDRDVYRMAIAAARHQSDVDIIHATPRREFMGGNHMHCVGHTGFRYEPNGAPRAWYGGIDRQAYANGRNGHSWCGGMFLACMMSGKADIGDSALLLADHLVRNSIYPYRNDGNPRSHGWMLEGLMQAFDATGDQRYLNAASSVADNLLKTQNTTPGWEVWPHGLSGEVDGQTNRFGVSCFQTGIVIQALHHYLRATNRPDLKNKISRAADWLRRAYVHEACGWPYDVGLNGSTRISHGVNMLIAASTKADGASQANKILREVLGFVLLRGVGHQGFGKSLAMDLVFAPVFFEMLDEMQEKNKFSLESFVSSRIRESHFLRMRGPERMEFSIRLKHPMTELCFERRFYHRNKNRSKHFQVTVRSSSGVVVKTFGDETRTSVYQNCCRLSGFIGEIFVIVIEDDVSSHWEAYCSDETPLHIHLEDQAQFGNGCPLYFKFRVPAGIKRFAVMSEAIHDGVSGLIVLDPNKRFVGIDQVYNSQKNSKKRHSRVEVFRRQVDKEECYSFMSWSYGDVLLKLEGVPPYLEYTRMSGTR